MSRVFTITEGLENMGALRTGGQGSVYKGRRIGPIISAVKILPTPIYSESAEDKNYRNFSNEVEKLKKVNEIPNPNVVKILNSGITESGSFPFIEMEYIEGPDLEELLKPPHGPVFSIKEVIKVADQLACALAHCHKVGVKHGDVKSNNVKYNVHSGNYVLLDFGLSVMSDEQRRTSMRHAGAIEFMAPEQNDGEMLFQTDVYSYGIILYELLAGQAPFRLKDNGETARNAVMIAHMELPVPNLLDVRSKNLPEDWEPSRKEKEMQVPGWLLNIISRCLEKPPEKRFENGIALHDAIVENSIADIKTDKVTGVNPVAVARATTAFAKPADPQNYNQPVEEGMMLISKPVFIGLMVLLAAFMAFSGYSLFNKPKQIVPVTIAKTDTVKIPDTSGKRYSSGYWERRRKEKARLDSIRQQAIQDDINKDQQNTNPADSSQKDTNKNNLNF